MSRGHPPWFLLWHSPAIAAAVGLAFVLLVVLTVRYWPPIAVQIEAWWHSVRRG